MIACVPVKGYFEVNCYLWVDDATKHGFLIDPGAQGHALMELCRENGWTMEKILLTHGHFDHIGGIEALREEDTPVYIHPLDREMLGNPALNASEGLLRRRVVAPEASCFVHEGEELHLAGMTVQVLHTPGHTPGSVCYRIGDDLFTGDTLFNHGWGRTDLPGGSEQDMFSSLRRLIPMAKTSRVHPRHAD